MGQIHGLYVLVSMVAGLVAAEFYLTFSCAWELHTGTLEGHRRTQLLRICGYVLVDASRGLGLAAQLMRVAAEGCRRVGSSGRRKRRRILNQNKWIWLCCCRCGWRGRRRWVPKEPISAINTASATSADLGMTRVLLEVKSTILVFRCLHCYFNHNNNEIKKSRERAKI